MKGLADPFTTLESVPRLREFSIDVHPDHAETVVAQTVTFEGGGVVAFWRDSRLVVAYPAGWLAVTEYLTEDVDE